MLKYGDVGYEEAQTKASLDYLISFLEEHSNWETPHTYTILEYFPQDKINYEPKIYQLTNITMELDNEVITSSDIEKNIYEDDTRVLIGFCVSSILYIGFQTQDKKITISFSDGYIQIYY